MNLSSLAPGAIRHDELDWPRILADQFPVKFQRIRAGIKQQRPILRRQKIRQIECFPALSPDAQLAVDQRLNRQQTRIAAPRQLTVIGRTSNSDSA